jgi:hypothetical protein
MLWIRNSNYMETRIYFLLCNYMHTNPTSTDPSTQHTPRLQLTKKTIIEKKFIFPTLELFQVARITDVTKATDIAGHWSNVSNNTHTHNIPHLV